MDSSKSSKPAAQSEGVQQDLELEISKLVTKQAPKWRSDEEITGPDEGTTPFEQGGELERLRSSIAQSTSSSIDGLANLTSELQKLENLLNSEIQRVKSEIDGALAGIKIIIDAIAPLKNANSPPLVPSMGTRKFEVNTKTSGSR